MLKASFSRKQLVIPYGLFLLLFVIFPLLLIFYYAFSNREGQLSLINLTNFFSDTSKLRVLLMSVLIGGGNTILCLLIGYPISYILSNKKYNKNAILIVLFIMPMWINFVLRTTATRDLLTWIGIKGSEMPFVATMIGMVYNYLPFAILPLYSTMLKMDKSLIEASSDLGATPTQTFVKAIIPMTMPGVVSAATMVFMPTMSSYVICDVLGNGKVILIGKSIETSFYEGSWNDGSFVAVIMLLMIGISLLITKNMKKDDTVRGNIW